MGLVGGVQGGIVVVQGGGGGLKGVIQGVVPAEGPSFSTAPSGTCKCS